MWLLNIVYVVAVVILLFGAAVFVHEYGHYWMALRRGLRIEGFSIGFGPKIVSWMRDGVEWSWRWIPAGGFVKLPQLVTSEALEGKSAEPVEDVPVDEIVRGWVHLVQREISASPIEVLF